MPIPAAALAGLKALYASKAFWPVVTGGAFLGQEALGQVGKAGERGVMREQIKLQEALQKAQAEATKQAVRESRKQAEKHLKELTKAKREERKEQRESALMQSFVNSQDRQLAMILGALQGVSQNTPATGIQPSRAGMLGLMRSRL